jgi:cysteinyl-tRNA synthetase
VHNGFVDMGSEKMSKSLGNIVTPAELLAQGHRGETLRLALLSAHYRQPLSWTEEVIAQAKTNLDRLYRAAGDAEPSEPDHAVVDALSNDLNTPLALSRLMTLRGGALKASAALLGLLSATQQEWFQGLISGSLNITLDPITVEATGKLGLSKETIDSRIAERAAAKKNRDFATADRIREELKAEGVILEDGPNGTTWRRE